MIERKTLTLFNYQISKLVEQAREDAYRGADLTAEELLQHLLENRELIVKFYEEPTSRTFIQRVNLIWLYPLAILSLPFQYLFTGNTGYNRNTGFGKIMHKLIGQS